MKSFLLYLAIIVAALVGILVGVYTGFIDLTEAMFLILLLSTLILAKIVLSWSRSRVAK